jgi:uncharacterized membrane protein YhaH (DUF805 family)
MEWYLTVLRKYAQFSGRSRRSEYWYFVLFNILISIGLAIVDNVVGLGGVLGAVYALAVLVPGLAVSIRRLHDVSKSGWWLLIALIPLLGAIALLVFMATDSTPGENEYGTNPKEGEFVHGGAALG